MTWRLAIKAVIAMIEARKRGLDSALVTCADDTIKHNAMRCAYEWILEDLRQLVRPNDAATTVRWQVDKLREWQRRYGGGQ